MEDSAPENEGYTQRALKEIREAVKGNGVRTADASLLAFNGDVAEFTARTTVSLKSDISRKSVGGKISGSEVLKDPGEADVIMAKALEQAKQSGETADRIKAMILEREDKGFGSGSFLIDLPFMNREFVSHAQCNACNSSGQVRCPRCTGQGYEKCPRCKGHGMEICKRCHGRKEVPGPGGAMQTCTFCRGLGKTQCLYCKRQGKIQCPSCRTRGSIPCTQCAGNGWSSTVMSAKVRAACDFECYLEKLPENAASYVRNSGDALGKRVKFSLDETAGKKEEGIAVSYVARLPYGQASFGLGKKRLDAFLCGAGGEIAEIPDFLDTLLKPGAMKLAKAAEGGATAEALLKEAAKYRTIKQAVMAAARPAHSKAITTVLRLNPLGLSETMAAKLANDALAALKKLAGKRLVIATAIGVACAFPLPLAYFLTPLRTAILARIASPALHTAADVSVPALAIMIGIFAVQMLRSQAKKTVLFRIGLGQRKKRR